MRYFNLSTAHSQVLCIVYIGVGPGLEVTGSLYGSCKCCLVCWLVKAREDTSGIRGLQLGSHQVAVHR